MSWVSHKRAIVRVIGHSIAVFVVVANVSPAIPILIVLVVVGLVRTVVQGVRNSVLVTVLTYVAHIANSILVPVRLIRVAVLWAVVTDIAQAISVRVLLIAVWMIRTVVISVATGWFAIQCVGDSIPVDVLIAGISFPVSIRVMFIVSNIGTQVAGVPIPVIVPIRLVRVRDAWAVVAVVFYPIVVAVVVANVANAIVVSVLLPRVWSVWTIVGPTLLRIVSSCDFNPSCCQLVSTVQFLVGVAVQVGVGSALLSVSCPANPAGALDGQGVKAPGLSFLLILPATFVFFCTNLLVFSSVRDLRYGAVGNTVARLQIKRIVLLGSKLEVKTTNNIFKFDFQQLSDTQRK